MKIALTITFELLCKNMQRKTETIVQRKVFKKITLVRKKLFLSDQEVATIIHHTYRFMTSSKLYVSCKSVELEEVSNVL